jgi:DNA-binding response OmpR family regulator
MSEHALEGRRYLVVEDEYLVASSLVAALENEGARVYGPVSDLERAMEVAAQSDLSLDAALLDVNLHGGLVYPAAGMLQKRNIPFIFVTGDSATSLPAEFGGAPCFTKPYDERDLIALLLQWQRPDPAPG